MLCGMATYVVGDIQGCYKQLRTLLKQVQFNPEKDNLWCVGDLVNRGPNSLETLRFLKSLGKAATCILGNHDLHLLELVAGGVSYHRDTLEEVLGAPDREELTDWLRHRPILHHDEDLGWCMVHAGLHPKWTLQEAKRRACEVEGQLRSRQWEEFCKELHHRKFPPREPKGAGSQSLLFSAAVFTRSRYCTCDGDFNWSNRSGESHNSREVPWFSCSQLAWQRECHVVYGHWAAKGLVTDQQHVLGLDSGCVWGGAMTLAKLKPKGQWKIVAQAE